MQIDRETIIKLVLKAGVEWYGVHAEPDGDKTLWKGDIESLIRLAAEHEREAIIAILKGIDETEIESPDGWWETSTGAEFGASILAAIRARSNNA